MIPPPSQNYKSSHKGFSLAELTAAAVIMVGIWLGALAYMNAASEEFEEAKEETLDNAPKEDIAILTEIRAAERALVASEAVTEEAREAWEEARKAAERRYKLAHGSPEEAYRLVFQDWLDAMDTLYQNGVAPEPSALNALMYATDYISSHKYNSRGGPYSGPHYEIQMANNRRWPPNVFQQGFCRENIEYKRRWARKCYSESGGRILIYIE